MGVIYLKPSDVQEQIDKIKQMGGNARFKLVGGTWLHGQYWDLYIDRINPETNKPQKNFKVLSYKGLAEVSSELDRIIATTRNPELLAHPWYRGSSRLLLKNPPFYAHNLYEKKTHGLTLHQMRRLYRMVSAGNQKAITYARNVLGIPFSESPSQVKAVVLHHVRDLAERRVRRNPHVIKGGRRILAGYAKHDIKLLGTGLKINKGDLVLLEPATNIPGGGYFARPAYPTGIWTQVSEDDSILIRPSEFKSDITFKRPVFGSKSFERMIRRRK